MKFNLWRYFLCLVRGGHLYKNSRSRRGYATCQKCGRRKRWR